MNINQISRNIIFILPLILSISAYTQNPDIQFDRVSIQEGLSDHSINCVTQDHIGFIWIGGSNGLYKYDGYDFTYFEYQPGNLRNQYFKDIYRIKEDKHGLLWMSSEIGIVVFNPENGKSRLLKLFTNVEIPNNYRPDLIIDSDNNIWATYNKGLIKISYSDDIKNYMTDEISFNQEENIIKTEIFNLPHSNTETNNLVITIYEDQFRNLLIGCISGLFLFDKENKVFNELLNDSESEFNYVRSIVQSQDSSYWIAATNFLYYMAKIDTVYDENISYVLPKNSKFEINRDLPPTSLLITQNNTILVGTDKERYRVIIDDENNIRLVLLTKTENDPEYYGYTKTYRDIFEDRTGVIWTAQEYYGVTRFNLNSSPFNSYENLIINNFKSTDINPLYKDVSGNLWIGTYGGGLYKVEDSIFTVSQYYMYKQRNNIMCMEEFSPEILWVGTSRGLVEFNTKKGISSNPHFIALDVINQKEIFISDLLKTDGMMYIATLDGLFIFDIKNETLSSYSLTENNLQKDRINRILSLSRMKDGAVLAGTSLEGIIKISLTHSQPEFTQIVNSKMLLDHGIYLGEKHRILEDSDGMIWIVDNSGLHSLHPDTLEINNYKLFDNINFPVAWSITEDKHKNLWIGTHFGLCCFNKTTKEVSVYDKKNGLPFTIHGINSVLNDNDGKLYFGGIGGFYDFYPDSIKVNNFIPPVVITDIMLFNKSISEDNTSYNVISSAIPYQKTLKFKYNQNDLSFKFSALDYNKPFENKYLYKLDGYQEKWTQTDANNRIVNYLKLKPGEYVFRVKGSNNSGIWNEDGTFINITIRKPWWTTYLAWISYLIITFSGIIGIFRWRLYRLKKERAELENLVSKRTFEISKQSKKISEQKDLLEQQNIKIREDEELKVKFFANISHEFRTPLSLIKGPTEEMLSDPQVKAKERKKLEMIKRNSQRLLNLVNQLLDISKFDANKIILEISEGDVMKHLKNTAILFVSVAESKSIDFQCFFDNEVRDSWFDSEKIEKILTNLLSNAFKFTPTGGEIKLNAKYIVDELSDFSSILEFSVTDDGPGVSEQNQDKIFDRFYQAEKILNIDNVGTGIGLSLSRDLARLMHGDITFKNRPRSGSIFSVRIPLGKSHLKESEYKYINKQRDDIKDSGPINKVYLNSDTEEQNLSNEKEKPLILIVDDNSDMRNYLSVNLNSTYNTQFAVDGTAGLIKAQETVPELIITDLMMPNMNGLELCQKIKENEITSHIPIIILTAKDTDADKMNGLQTGADDYISKPFNMLELKIKVANLIEQRIKLRERFSKEIILEPGNIKINSADEKFLSKSIAVIENNMKDETFDLLMFREEMNLSRSTLFRKISALTGQSPTEFIRTIRLKRAAELIRNNFGNITEISFEVGFNNLSYFNRSFKKLYGVSPKEFSKKENEK